jgi:hypothetical protein
MVQNKRAKMKHNVRDENGRFCKRPVIKGYKGFNKGLICRNKQYKVGETYKEQGEGICEEGMMHFCESPLDVLEYYPAVDTDTGEPNEYAEVEAVGMVIRGARKSATNKLRIVKKISLEKLIKDAVATRRKAKAVTTVDWSEAATTGDFSDVATSETYSNAATTGRCASAVTTKLASNAITAGNCSNATTAGNQAHAITAGTESDAVTTGKFSCAVAAGCRSHAASTGRNSSVATLGRFSNAATTGRFSNAVTTGEYSRVTTVGRRSNAAALGERSYVTASGKHSIAAALGAESRAKAALGNWLVLAEYDCEGKLLHVKAVKVDGKEIKPDTFYMLQYGKIIKG